MEITEPLDNISMDSESIEDVQDQEPISGESSIDQLSEETEEETNEQVDIRQSEEQTSSEEVPVGPEDPSEEVPEGPEESPEETDIYEQSADQFSEEGPDGPEESKEEPDT